MCREKESTLLVEPENHTVSYYLYRIFTTATKKRARKRKKCLQSTPSKTPTHDVTTKTSIKKDIGFKVKQRTRS
jgi:hypothetical protein